MRKLACAFDAGACSRACCGMRNFTAHGGASSAGQGGSKLPHSMAKQTRTVNSNETHRPTVSLLWAGISRLRAAFRRGSRASSLLVAREPCRTPVQVCDKVTADLQAVRRDFPASCSTTPAHVSPASSSRDATHLRGSSRPQARRDRRTVVGAESPFGDGRARGRATPSTRLSPGGGRAPTAWKVEHRTPNIQRRTSKFGVKNNLARASCGRGLPAPRT